MKKRYVIIKAIHESGQSYKMKWYYRDQVFGFIHQIELAYKYHNKDTALFGLSQIKDKGIYQVEKIYIVE